MKIIGLTLFVSLLYGCSNQAAYETVQQSQKNECAKLPQGQYEDCMHEVDTSYDDYERERQEVINAP